MFRMCKFRYCKTLGLQDVQNMQWLECGMLNMQDVWDVVCLECVMTGMWNVYNVGCSGCAIFDMCDVLDVRCGIQDVCWSIGIWFTKCPSSINPETCQPYCYIRLLFLISTNLDKCDSSRRLLVPFIRKYTEQEGFKMRKKYFLIHI